jgi:hypothetical protein
LGWALNREEFLTAASQSGMALIREFLIRETPAVRGAPEQFESRGYLFARSPEPGPTIQRPQTDHPPL